MNRKEFLKELLVSIKRGRLHRVLRVVLIVLFIYVSFQIGQEIFNFYLTKKRVTEFKLDGLSVSFGKITTCSFSSFRYRDERRFVQITNATIEIDILKSISNVKPFIKFAKVDSLQVRVKQEKKFYKRYFPEVGRIPLGFKYCCLDIKNALIKAGNDFLSFERLYLGKKSFELKGLRGILNGNPFVVSNISGNVSNNLIKTERFRLTYNGFLFDGNLNFNKDFSLIDASGSFRFKKFSGESHFKKLNRSFELKSSVFYDEENFFNLEVFGEVYKKIFIKDGILKKDKSLLKFSGYLDKFSLNLSGKGEINDLKLRKPFNISVGQAFAEFRFFGSLRAPTLQFRFHSYELVIKGNFIKDLSSNGQLLNGRFLNADFSADFKGKINGNLNADVLNGTGNGTLSCKKVNFKEILLSMGVRKHVKWIPKLVASGKSNISFKNWKLSRFTAQLNVNEFSFRGYKASGNLNLKTSVGEILFFKTMLSGKEGSVISQGAINIGTLNIVSYSRFQNFDVSCLSFLKKAGLSGNADGDGKLWGSLRNPSGLFSFSSENFLFQGEAIGSVKGNAYLSDYVLRFSGETDDEKVVLDKLNLTIRPGLSADLSLKVQDVSVEKVMNIVRRLKVRIPINLFGSISGNVDLSIPNLKQIKENLNVSVSVENFSGQFLLGDISGNVSKVFGEIAYDGGLEFSFDGDVNAVSLRNLYLRNGTFSISLKREKLLLRVVNFGLRDFDSSKGRLLLKVNISDRSIDGGFHLLASRKIGFANTTLDFNGSLSGTLDKFDVNLVGKGNVNSNYFSPVQFSFKGLISEPENRGNIEVKSSESRVSLTVDGTRVGVSGVIKDLTLNLKNYKVKIGMAVPKFSMRNFDISSLNGTLSIPVISIYPERFYKLYSVSGVYLNFREGKVLVSDMKFSYIDGWIDISSVEVLNGTLKASIDSEVGLKGILNRFGLMKYVSSVRGKLKVKGDVEYTNNLDYRISIFSKNLSLRLSYVLGRLSFGTVDVKISPQGVESLFAEGNVGDGNLVITGSKKKGFLISFIDFPFGRSGLWKASVTGNLLLREKILSGELNVSKAKLISLKVGKGEKLTFPVSVDISLNFIEPFVINTDIWSMEILPRLRLKTKGKKIVIPGSYYISSGWINYMGKKFDVSYGSGTIEDLSELKGKINLIASARVSDYYVYMNVRGKMSSPSLFLSSDPPLSREQILNLITTGASPEEIERSSELFPAVQVAYYITSAFLKPVERGFTKGLRLEAFSVEPYITKYGETVVKLSMSKKFTDRFKILGYQTTGQRPEYSVGIQMFLIRKFYLETRYNSYYGPETGIGFEFNIR